MRTFGLLFVACSIAFASLASSACQTPAILEVKTGPGTDYPCGVGGTMCKGGTSLHPVCCARGMACTNGFIDGPDVQCEFWGDDVIPDENLGAHLTDGGTPEKHRHVVPALRF